MANKAKKAKRKHGKQTTSSKQTKPNKKPTKQKVTPVAPPPPEPPPQATQPPTPQPNVVVERVVEAPRPEPVPTAIMMLPSKKTTVKVMAQIGRYIVHASRNIHDELTITDIETGKPVAHVHQNVPLTVINWIAECAEFIQSNPRMDDVVRLHGMTNVKAACGSATALVLSKHQLPEQKISIQQ